MAGRSRLLVSKRVLHVQTAEQRGKPRCAAAGHAEAANADTASKASFNEQRTPSLPCYCSPCHIFADGMLISCSCREIKQGWSKETARLTLPMHLP